MLIKYVGLEIDPNKAIQARNKGLPVFYGDIGRQEVAEAFNVGKAKAVVVCIADKAMANRAVIALRRWYPDLKIFARAADADHASRLQKTLDVAAMVPILPEDNLLLTLPFGGAVLKALGSPAEEVNAILEVKRKEVLSGKTLEQDEERMALLQLGIDPAAEKKKREEKEKLEQAAKFVDVTAEFEKKEKQEDQERAEEDGDRFESVVEASRERFDEMGNTSPFVASVIGGVCPSATEDDDDDIKEETVELLAAADLPALKIVTDDESSTAERNSTDVELSKKE